ncbi:MAG: 3-hydroxyacyl-ACP dehydratase, partial [Deltaproteobacteria bacterium]
MTTVGIDLGSRAIKVVAFSCGEIVGSEVVESSYEPHRQALGMVEKYNGAKVVATGYGRHLATKHFADKAITEIKAHAKGSRYHYPECRTIIDVGGQDSKVISLGVDGSVSKFQMNDKCAAGTGRFLEIMAASLGYTLEEFAAVGKKAQKDVPINSMCAVFAESEVVSLRNRGTPPEEISRAIHLSIAERLSNMVERLGIEGEVVFTGGVARNQLLVDLLGERLRQRVNVPVAPELTGAL